MAVRRVDGVEAAQAAVGSQQLVGAPAAPRDSHIDLPVFAGRPHPCETKSEKAGTLGAPYARPDREASGYVDGSILCLHGRSRR